MSINFNYKSSEELRVIPDDIVSRENYSSISGNNIEQGSTYLDLISSISEDHSLRMRKFFDKVEIFDLENHGLPQYYFIVILHTILAEGLFNSISESNFISNSDVDLEVSLDIYKTSLDNLFRFLTGQFKEDDYLKFSNLIKDPDFYSFVSRFILPVGSTLESAVQVRTYSFSSLSSQQSERGSELTCEEIAISKLPVLSLEHFLSCETGFDSNFSYPSVLIHYKFITYSFALVSSLIAVKDYQSLMNFFLKDKDSINELLSINTECLTKLGSLFPEKRPKKILMISKIMNDYSRQLQFQEFSKLAQEAKLKERKAKNQERALRKAAEKEAKALKEAQAKEEARMALLKRQEELAEQERLTEIEKKALLEQIAIAELVQAKKATEQAKELYLEKLHFVVEKKQEVIERLAYLINQLKALVDDDSNQVLSFKKTLNDEISLLKSNYDSLTDVDSLNLETEIQIQIDSSKGECLEYIEMLDNEFLLLNS